MSFAVFFNEADPGKSGGKGKNLVALSRASFPVPPGFIVTFESYRLFRESGGEEMPGPVLEAVLDCYSQLVRAGGNDRVAVRSSASAEDLENASFAGQHDTYLYVRGEDELIPRIRDCWKSLYSPRGVKYRERMGMNIPDEQLNMAVVVQAMVDPVAAGIFFTSYTVPGGTDAMVIESNWGCGETVVSGLATPDHFVVDRDAPF
ncbi:MAG: phosphoenolpyruvate synthase, partial [bacterium]|nr:phosphoenolpyruvate synthase [bacterium]